MKIINSKTTKVLTGNKEREQVLDIFSKIMYG